MAIVTFALIITSMGLFLLGAAALIESCSDNAYTKRHEHDCKKCPLNQGWS